ncbi:MAG: hypothetical protein V4640_15440 [Verrucomicrobiota bacterium]
MTRLLAVLGAIFCISIFSVVAVTENVREDVSLQLVIINSVGKIVSVISLLLYCGFAALHSVSRVEYPGDRVGWIIIILGLNVVGSLIYYLTKYQDFRVHGLGKFVQWEKTGHSFYRATPSELQAPKGINPDA